MKSVPIYYNDIYWLVMVRFRTLKKQIDQHLILQTLEQAENAINAKEDCWEWYSKYIKQNCVTYFPSMQFTNRDHLAVVALSDCQDIIAARSSVLVHWMRRKKLKQF